jgi:predicted helicase
VVSYIVRSVDQILRDSFGKPDGLADPSVTVLDPAAGTMTFPATAVRLAAETYKAKYGDGSLDSWIKGHVLRDFYAFELMMAPYAIGHLRMGTLLAELGYTMNPDDRFKLYLTNTLDVSTAEQNPIPGLSPLADESHTAEEVKTRQPILVIMGNPPYSGTSSNKGEWISKLITDYKRVDGKPLGEKNPKMLQDDYVKFMRFAQWKIDQAGEGILGFITNHGYLDNLTFRGMRQSLMASFDQLHILNLHGNALKKEKSPDGTKDENVFDIQQGVAIVLAVKKKGLQQGIWQADLWGTRDNKYAYLTQHEAAQTAWQELHPRAETYLLIPRDNALASEYEMLPSLTEIFNLSNVGLYTSRDALTIHFDAESVWQTVSRFAALPSEEAREAFSLPDDVRDWKVALAQDDLRRSGPSRANIAPILYRPFDIRYTYYTGRSRGFLCMPRNEVMRHMLSENIGLCCIRQAAIEDTFSHALVCSDVVDNRVFLSSKGVVQLCPLYLNGDDLAVHGHEVFTSSGQARKRVSNLNPAVMLRVARSLCLDPVPDGRGDLAHGSMGPEDLFAYIYAILYSPTYRTRYAEFLKTDFPRIPFTKDRDTFLKLVEFGQQLIDLHLMRSPELDNPISRFCGKGDGAVIKVEYDADRGRISINPTQYFDGVTPDLWAYQIGGYQVLSKWLKDRKGRFLTAADSKHYSQVVTLLGSTTVIQRRIDVAFQGM